LFTLIFAFFCLFLFVFIVIPFQRCLTTLAGTTVVVNRDALSAVLVVVYVRRLSQLFLRHCDAADQALLRIRHVAPLPAPLPPRLLAIPFSIFALQNISTKHFFVQLFFRFVNNFLNYIIKNFCAKSLQNMYSL